MINLRERTHFQSFHSALEFGTAFGCHLMNICTEEDCLKFHFLLFFKKGVVSREGGRKKGGALWWDLLTVPVLVSGGAVHSRSGFSHHLLDSPAPDLSSSPRLKEPYLNEVRTRRGEGVP